MNDFSGLIINVGATLIVLLATYFIGTRIEKKHYRSILSREEEYRGFPVATFHMMPSNWNIESVHLAQGSVVISIDYFKRFVATLRCLIGGRISTYEPLLDRARREAVLRMIEDAKANGCNAVINVRLETARLANSTPRGERVAGVEMFAFGTALRLGK